MMARAVFAMPAAVKITGRTSTITNSFVNSIIPVVPPSETEVHEALAVLGMTPESIACSYCGDKMTEWDHLRPLVRGKRPTGYISEIANLVPACGKCNQSKSGADWREWIVGPAKQSPRSRGISDLDARIGRLIQFESWREPRRVDFERVVPADLCRTHWDNHDRLHSSMRECQRIADQVRTAALRAIGE
jgi:hypothetical protein